MTMQQGFSSCKWLKMTLRIVLRRPRWSSATKMLLTAGANALQMVLRIVTFYVHLASKELWRVQRCTPQLWKGRHLSERASPDDLNEVYLSIHTHCGLSWILRDVGAWHLRWTLLFSGLILFPAASEHQGMFRITHFCFKEGKSLVEDGNVAVLALKNATPA